MEGRDFIMVLDNVIPESLIDRLLDYHTSARQRGMTHPGGGAGGYTPEAKKSEQITLHLDNPLQHEVDQIFIAARERYLDKVTPGYPDSLVFRSRPSHLVRYPQGVGEMMTHADMQSASVAREITLVGYLTTVDEGGETLFSHQGIAVRPVRGRVAVFPPFWMFPHSSQVPVTQDKYVVATIHTVARRKA